MKIYFILVLLIPLISPNLTHTYFYAENKTIGLHGLKFVNSKFRIFLTQVPQNPTGFEYEGVYETPDNQKAFIYSLPDRLISYIQFDPQQEEDVYEILAYDLSGVNFE
jgi:hypothetical protein